MPALCSILHVFPHVRLTLFVSAEYMVFENYFNLPVVVVAARVVDMIDSKVCWLCYISNVYQMHTPTLNFVLHSRYQQLRPTYSPWLSSNSPAIFPVTSELHLARKAKLCIVNKTGARQYTWAVLSIFAEIHSTHPISAYVHRPSLSYSWAPTPVH